MQHPLTDEFAYHLYVRTPLRYVDELAHLDGSRGDTWEDELPEVRAAFRTRARQFMAGDMSVEPWRFIAHPLSRLT